MLCDKNGAGEDLEAGEKNLDFLNIFTILNFRITMEIYAVLEDRPRDFNRSNRGV